MNRNIDALKEYHEKCVEYGCEKIYCIGTSALRDSKNKIEFIKRAESESNICVEVIDGDLEAKLGFLGVISSIEVEGNILVLDIGGGSTEFIFGNKDGIKKNISLNIGALRLTEKFLSNGYSEESLLNMKSFIKENIKDVVKYLRQEDISCICGIGGTITSLSAVNQDLKEYSMEKVHGSKIKIEEVRNMLNRFINCSDDERKHINGLQPKRADIITAGTEILVCIMEDISEEEIIVSEYDNLEGMIYYK